MPHGDFSDLGALTMWATSACAFFYPEFFFMGVGPLKPFFDTRGPETEFMLRFLSGFLMTLGCMLFTVRWNTINGKMSGLACVLSAVNVGFAFHEKDNGVFVPRTCYVFAAVLAVTGLHLMFNANPLTKAPKQARD